MTASVERPSVVKVRLRPWVGRKREWLLRVFRSPLRSSFRTVPC